MEIEFSDSSEEESQKESSEDVDSSEDQKN